MNKFLYMLNVTFHDGTDLPEDTDRKVCLLSTSKQYDFEYIDELFKEVNKKLNNSGFNYDLGFSYEENGVNILTLLGGVLNKIHKSDRNATIDFLDNDCGGLVIDNYYVIEQWR